MIRHAYAPLLAVLLAALPAWGQSLSFGTVDGQNATFGTASGQSYSQPPAGSSWSPATALDAVAAYDPGDTSTLIKGGYDLVPADDDYFARTSGAIPLVSSGTPQYPISVVCWFKPDSVTGVQSLVYVGTDGSANHKLQLASNGTALFAQTRDASSNATAQVSGVLTIGRWACAVAVFAAVDSRAIYVDTNTTGATEATSHTLTGINSAYMGRNSSGAAEFDGVIAYTAILPVDLSGAGNASIRAAIFSGADPETASSTTATALYKFDNDNGVDAKGSFNLTASGSPTAQNNLIVMRSLVGTYHQRATTSAPTYDSTLFGNRGGITFNGSSNFLVCASTPITAAPFQIYSVASAANVTADCSVMSIGNTAVDLDFWAFEFRGASAGDTVLFFSVDATAASAATSTTYTANTTRLLWGLETSNVSRAVRLDGAGEGTNTTDRTPDGAAAITIGKNATNTYHNYLNGNFGFGLVLNSTDVSERADVHSWVDTNFGTSLP